MPETKIKRMNLNLELDLHNAFKAATAAKGQQMTVVITDFIRDYIKKNGFQPKKGRR